MSDDQLDDDLKKRIRQVFDNYEDDTANEGWLLLREKYPEKEEDRGVFWLWWRIASVAALLLIALGVGLWFNSHEAGKQNIAQHTKKNSIADTSATAKTAVITSDKKQKADSGANLAYQQQATATVDTHTYGPAKNTPFAQAGVNNSNSSANTGNTLFTAKADSNTVKGVIAYKADKKNNLLSSSDSSAIKTVAANKPLTLISTRPATAPAVKEQPKVVADNQVSKGMQALFDKEAKNRATQNTEEQKTIDKKVAFSIYAATYVNYAKGSDKQFNTGVGATADIRLTDNLRLSTGVSIGQNTLSYANNNTTAVIPVALMAAASHNFTANSSSVLYSVAPASSNLNANLVNLDIPVDLKYVFNPQKGNTYVSAGFSSGTFINETYNTTYNYNGNGSSIQQTGDATHKSFDNFYFAQMLNVSFGVGYPVGKNQLIIEPFFKYPLNGMGDEHLLFGSGGLNLKFNFDPPKSKH